MGRGRKKKTLKGIVKANAVKETATSNNTNEETINLQDGSKDCSININLPSRKSKRKAVINVTCSSQESSVDKIPYTRADAVTLNKPQSSIPQIARIATSAKISPNTCKRRRLITSSVKAIGCNEPNASVPCNSHTEYDPPVAGNSSIAVNIPSRNTISQHTGEISTSVLRKVDGLDSLKERLVYLNTKDSHARQQNRINAGGSNLCEPTDKSSTQNIKIQTPFQRNSNEANTSKSSSSETCIQILSDTEEFSDNSTATSEKSSNEVIHTTVRSKKKPCSLTDWRKQQYLKKQREKETRIMWKEFLKNKYKKNRKDACPCKVPPVSTTPIKMKTCRPVPDIPPPIRKPARNFARKLLPLHKMANSDNNKNKNNSPKSQLPNSDNCNIKTNINIKCADESNSNRVSPISNETNQLRNCDLTVLNEKTPTKKLAKPNKGEEPNVLNDTHKHKRGLSTTNTCAFTPHKHEELKISKSTGKFKSIRQASSIQVIQNINKEKNSKTAKDQEYMNHLMSVSLEHVSPTIKNFVLDVTEEYARRKSATDQKEKNVHTAEPKTRRDCVKRRLQLEEHNHYTKLLKTDPQEIGPVTQPSYQEPHLKSHAAKSNKPPGAQSELEPFEEVHDIYDVMPDMQLDQKEKSVHTVEPKTRRDCVKRRLQLEEHNHCTKLLKTDPQVLVPVKQPSYQGPHLRSHAAKSNKPSGAQSELEQFEEVQDIYDVMPDMELDNEEDLLLLESLRDNIDLGYMQTYTNLRDSSLKEDKNGFKNHFAPHRPEDHLLDHIHPVHNTEENIDKQAPNVPDCIEMQITITDNTQARNEERILREIDRDNFTTSVEDVLEEEQRLTVANADENELNTDAASTNNSEISNLSVASISNVHNYFHSQNLNALGLRRIEAGMTEDGEVPETLIRPWYLPKFNARCKHCGAITYQLIRNCVNGGYYRCCHFGKIKLNPLLPPGNAVKRFSTLGPNFKDNTNYSTIRTHHSLKVLGATQFTSYPGFPSLLPAPSHGARTVIINGMPTHTLFPISQPTENQESFNCTQLLVIGNEFQNTVWRRRYSQYRIPVHVFREIDDEFMSGHPLRRQFNIIYNLIHDQDRQDRDAGRIPEYYYMREVFPRKNTPREIEQMLRQPERSDEVGIAYVGEQAPENVALRIYPNLNNGKPQSLHFLHAHQHMLSFPLLLPRGGFAFLPGIKYMDGKTNVSMNKYFRYYLQKRASKGQMHLLQCGKATQLFIINLWLTVEMSRLKWQEDNQKSLMRSTRDGLEDALHMHAVQTIMNQYQLRANIPNATQAESTTNTNVQNNFQDNASSCTANNPQVASHVRTPVQSTNATNEPHTNNDYDTRHTTSSNLIETELGGAHYIVNDPTLNPNENDNEPADNNNTDFVRRARVGVRVKRLSSSFVGSKAYYKQQFNDAVKMCQELGMFQLFKTFTCNVNHPNVLDRLDEHENPYDRPEVLAEVFMETYKDMLNYMPRVYGGIKGYFVVTEFQKRGAPHIHLLIWLDDPILTPERANLFVRATLPNKNKEPILRALVEKLQLHGPCGVHNPNAPCMKFNKRTQLKECSKKFPFPFSDNTVLDNGRGFFSPRRPFDGENNYEKCSKRHCNYEFTNRDVVPYCPRMLLRYQCHNNLVIIPSIRALYYCLKYATKGPDAGTYTKRIVGKGDELSILFEIDEIQNYKQYRYLGACEAAWRLLNYPIFEKSHAITRLHVHLPNEAYIYFQPGNEENALERANVSTLEAWFRLNARSDDDGFVARNMKYEDIPREFRIHYGEFVRKKRHTKPTLGRVIDVSPLYAELYSLRLLVLYRKGIKSFEKLREVDSTLHTSFHAAAIALGLQKNADVHIAALKEALPKRSPKKFRQYFIYLVAYSHLPEPEALFQRFKATLIQDFVRMGYNEENSLLRARNAMKKILQRMDIRHNLRWPEMDAHVIVEVLDDDPEPAPIMYREICEMSEDSLNNQQRLAYQFVMNSVDEHLLNHTATSRVILIDGPGGTGKTHLIKLICGKLLQRLNPTVKFQCCAFTGIAAQLLPYGQTIHSLFRLPLNVTKNSDALLPVESYQAKQIYESKVLIIDEFSMVSTHIINCIDKYLKFLMENDAPFGGKVTLLVGDPRQIAPFVPNSLLQQTIELSPYYSTVLKFSKRIRLETNERAANDVNFAQELLTIGEGKHEKIHGTYQGETIPPEIIHVPHNLRIYQRDLARFVFPNFHGNMNGAILAPTNCAVDGMNEEILRQFPGTEEIRFSDDEQLLDGQNLGLNFPIEYIRKLTPTGFPPHVLKLKINCTIMCLRNLNISEGLCNGTRLQVTSIGQHVIIGKILTGDFQGREHMIPRIIFESEAAQDGFKFQRIQFPVKLAFAMTINKAQGQTLSRVGLLLRSPSFTHGQYYVALSRATCKRNIRIAFGGQSQLNGEIIYNRTNGKPGQIFVTSNVVYKEIIQQADNIGLPL